MSYTYSRTFLRQNDKRIEKPVNNGDWYPTEYDKPHDFKFVGNYKFTHRYSMSINVDYSTGLRQPFLPDNIMMSRHNRCGLITRNETHTVYRTTFVQTSLSI